MKNLIKIIGLVTCFFLLLSGAVYLMISRHYRTENGMRNVVMNRMIMDLEACVQEGKSITADQIDSYISMDSYRQEYKKKDVEQAGYG